MRKTLIANKAFLYGTRALRAGDEFTAPRQDARALEAVRLAKPFQPGPADPLEELRREALAAGVKVDARWGEKRLRDEIAKAKDQ